MAFLACLSFLWLTIRDKMHLEEDRDSEILAVALVFSIGNTCVQ